MPPSPFAIRARPLLERELVSEEGTQHSVRMNFRVNALAPSELPHTGLDAIHQLLPITVRRANRVGAKRSIISLYHDENPLTGNTVAAELGNHSFALHCVAVLPQLQGRVDARQVALRELTCHYKHGCPQTRPSFLETSSSPRMPLHWPDGLRHDEQGRARPCRSAHTRHPKRSLIAGST